MAKRTFVYKDAKSDKFWSIEVSGTKYTVNYGRTGTAGQTQVKEFDSAAECKKAAEKKIAEKTKEGYTEGKAAAKAPAKKSAKGGDAATNAKTGDKGPAGGIMLAIGSYVLEVAPSDTVFKAAWDDAMKRCAKMKVNGIGGWRLPTKHELDAMNKELYKKGLGGFETGRYWSASESVSNLIFYHDFDDDDRAGAGNVAKYTLYKVRAVRGSASKAPEGPAGGIVLVVGSKKLEVAPKKTEFKANQDDAKAKCASIEVNGIGGWRLPTIDELEVMYQELHKNGLGEFKDASYWSATEENNGDFWKLMFQHYGDRNYSSNDFELCVRAVRDL
jgi:predicted DNA-binding WGR domain protein